MNSASFKVLLAIGAGSVIAANTQTWGLKQAMKIFPPDSDSTLLEKYETLQQFNRWYPPIAAGVFAGGLIFVLGALT